LRLRSFFFAFAFVLRFRSSSFSPLSTHPRTLKAQPCEHSGSGRAKGSSSCTA
jgi:hypothetical protein